MPKKKTTNPDHAVTPDGRDIYGNAATLHIIKRDGGVNQHRANYFNQGAQWMAQQVQKELQAVTKELQLLRQAVAMDTSKVVAQVAKPKKTVRTSQLHHWWIQYVFTKIQSQFILAFFIEIRSKIVSFLILYSFLGMKIIHS